MNGDDGVCVIFPAVRVIRVRIGGKIKARKKGEKGL
jgi:hypothetical protein